MKESPARLASAKELFKSAGAEIKAFYLTMGQYDAVAVTEPRTTKRQPDSR
jgi:uncharacterized protein with GYD domain